MQAGREGKGSGRPKIRILDPVGCMRTVDEEVEDCHWMEERERKHTNPRRASQGARATTRPVKAASLPVSFLGSLKLHPSSSLIE